jgi:hypothetical protein
MNSVFKNLRSSWQQYGPKDVDWFFRSYFLLLLIRLLIEYSRLKNEFLYVKPFHPISPFVQNLPPPALLSILLDLSLFLIPLCLIRRIRPYALLVLLPSLYWVITANESNYSPLLEQRFFHARIAVLYSLLAIAICEWIALIKTWLKLRADWFDRVAPLLLTQWILALVYLGPTIHRLLRYGYPGWYDGETLQSIFLMRWITYGGNWILFFSQHFWLCFLMQQIVLLIEGGFIFAIFLPRFAPIILAGAFMFHFFAESLMEVTFVDFTIILYGAFLQPRFFRDARALFRFTQQKS